MVRYKIHTRSTHSRRSYNNEMRGEEVQSLLTKVHFMMSIALAVTAVFAWVCIGRDLFSIDPETQKMMMSEYWIGALVAEIVVVLILIFGIDHLHNGVAGLLFFFYAALNGVTIAPVVAAYTEGSVALAFVVTGGTFLAMSIYGATTKKDLDSIGAFLFMGLCGLILAMLMNFLFRNELMDFLISCAAVLIFTGLTAWDTQKIKSGKIPGGRAGNKVVFGALMLYLDFINLFLHLLRLLGQKK